MKPIYIAAVELAQAGHGTTVRVAGRVTHLRLFGTEEWPRATFILDLRYGGNVIVAVPQFLGYRVTPWLASGLEVEVSGRVQRPFRDGPIFIRARAIHRARVLVGA